MDNSPSSTIHTTCCVVGGGPAGMMLGYLLARSGIHATVAGKTRRLLPRLPRRHSIHPSTLDLIGELGLLDEFLALPHQRIVDFTAVIGGQSFPIADLSRVPTHCKFVAHLMLPQWDFLNFPGSRSRETPHLPSPHTT